MIVFCCADLIFATRIRATADAVGVASRPARTADALQLRLDQVDDGKPNDPVTAVLVDLELGVEALAFIEQVKQHDPSIPVVAFGSHMAHDALAAARDHGADQVMPRSRFVVELPDLLRRFGPSHA